MESTLLMSVAAILSFVIFYVLEQKTWLHHLESNYALSYLWEFDVWQVGTAVVIGFTSSAICLGLLLTIGIVKQILLRIKMRCDATKFLSGTIVICTLGGFINGIPFLFFIFLIISPHRNFGICCSIVIWKWTSNQCFCD